MTTSAAIIVQDLRVGRNRLQYLTRRITDQVIYVTPTETVTSVCARVVEARSRRPADESIRMTLFCHGGLVGSAYNLEIGRGLSLSNLLETGPLRQCAFRKIVVKACGPINPTPRSQGPQRIGRDEHEMASLKYMHGFYLILAKILSTEFVAGEETQYTSADARGALTGTRWHGNRWVYTPDGTMRCKLERQDDR